MAQPITLSGQKVAEARIRAGLTQAALAARAGITAPYLGRLEAGTRSGTPATLVALAQALGVDLDAITDRAAA